MPRIGGQANGREPLQQRHNTARLGKIIADGVGARFTRVTTSKGIGDGFFSTPNWEKDVFTYPGKVDLSPHRLLFFGTPIWYWKPSVVIMSFLRRQGSLKGKRVVLFYTFEGGVRDSAIETWKELIRQKGGDVVDVLALNRDELAKGESLDDRARELVRQRRARWLPPEPAARPAGPKASD